ncbi:MAG: hypothetical protein CR986_00025 [Ignavibacteriae bacterium]|nr:MAG: hypothetical protein CR986_00025 [Ignavibacteriota bacterium]
MEFNFNLSIGLWNAWLPFLFYMVFTMVSAFLLSKEGFKRGGDRSWLTKKETFITTITTLSFYGTLILGIWIPLLIGTNLFYIGLGMYVIGIILSVWVGISFLTAPMGRLITKGAYKFSRNPIYMVNILIAFSIVLMSASWILVLMLVIYLVFNHLAILAEERFCLETYGEDFELYKKKVRRYL